MNIQPKDVLKVFENFSAQAENSTQPTNSLNEPIRASVLIPILKREELSILLTQRTEHLKSHAGQISFPGGQWEPDDRNPTDTALREAQEEIGLNPSSVQIISELGCWLTHTGYQITAILGFLDPPSQFRASEDEVAEIFEIPLHVLMTPDLFKEDFKYHNGEKRHFYHFEYENKHIWGFTANILKFLIEQLRASNEAL
ncbi:MAG: CoA pyrophosphatase [Gammaproteobacteria bacterium]